MVTNLSYVPLQMWMPYARKIGSAICEKVVLEPRKDGYFSFPKITKMENKSEKVENWHGAMN